MLFDPLSTGAGKAGGKLRIGQDTFECIGEARRIMRIREESGNTVFDNFVAATRPGADDRESRSHCF